ncbi:MAG: zf-TFIIB domain-containing protein, partial [Deltaproteobacteria bacterium]|nr:zf-TFIIB domain-containing protein [Deltaproteobacteria bacterium]
MEARYDCPVCLGAKMDKLKLGEKDQLTLDYCQRCGGIWFDFGEVGKLSSLPSTAMTGKVTLTPDHYLMQCHSCHAPLDRNASKCDQCGWENIIDCPVCQKPMGKTNPRDLHLDYCPSCKGVWFDNIELSEIWNGHLDSVAKEA